MTASALLRHGREHATVLLDGLEQWMASKGFSAVGEIRGKLAVPPDADATAYERASYVQALRRANGRGACTCHSNTNAVFPQLDVACAPMATKVSRVTLCAWIGRARIVARAARNGDGPRREDARSERQRRPVMAVGGVRDPGVRDLVDVDAPSRRRRRRRRAGSSAGRRTSRRSWARPSRHWSSRRLSGVVAAFATCSAASASGACPCAGGPQR